MPYPMQFNGLSQSVFLKVKTKYAVAEIPFNIVYLYLIYKKYKPQPTGFSNSFCR